MFAYLESVLLLLHMWETARLSNLEARKLQVRRRKRNLRTDPPKTETVCQQGAGLVWKINLVAVMIALT